MYRLLFLLLVLCACSVQPQAQSADTEELPVKDLEAKAKIMVSGNLQEGQTMPLQWAANSSVACFPGTRFNEYMGNHILYRVEMPARSKMNITVSPKDKKNRINVYALRLGADSMVTPPNVSSCISCEASYPIYAGKPNYRKAAKPQSVEYISINKPYTILIGVA
ncbi:MAG: hypothetical protein AAFO94_08580, partial [Bacteroidota bacterium]